MSSLTYTSYELKRMFRNRRFFIFSLAFPLLLFLVVGGSNRGSNCSIESFGGLDASGTSAVYNLVIKGTYYVNSNLWNG